MLTLQTAYVCEVLFEVIGADFRWILPRISCAAQCIVKRKGIHSPMTAPAACTGSGTFSSDSWVTGFKLNAVPRLLCSFLALDVHVRITVTLPYPLFSEVEQRCMCHGSYVAEPM